MNFFNFCETSIGFCERNGNSFHDCFYLGVIFYELLPNGQTINALKYCSQIDQLNIALKKLRPSLVNRGDLYYHHDNAKPHTARLTTQKLADLSYKVVPHAPYSPDKAPSDFHLFRSLQNSLNGKSFKSYAEVNQYLQEWFKEKPEAFFEKGIMKLPDIWQQIVNNSGEYA